jgi:phage/plasmid primase-like uncharacterized protein
MTNAPRENGLAAFFKERFNADPYAVVDYFDSDIAAAADQVGIDWATIRNDIRLEGDKYRGKIGTTQKRYKSKVMAWGQIKRADDFDYPHFTFNNNVASIGSSTWSGLGALADLYAREGGRQASEKHQRWLDRQAAQRIEREAQQHARALREREQQARIQAERLAFEKVWHCGGREVFEYEQKSTGKIRPGFVELIGEEDGSAPYLQAKGVGAIASRLKMQRMRDSHGEFCAVPLFNIAGSFVGIQRLYGDKKLQGTGVKMDGVHCILGDLETADRRYAAEGFATGATVYLAELEAGNNVAVVVTFNVDNLGKVLRLYKKHSPAWRFHNAADNDQWTAAGNAGLLAALEIHRELEHPGIVPDFAAHDELFGCSAQQIAELRAQSRAPVVGFCAEELAAFKAARKGPTDWNDYAAHFGLEATAKALRARGNVYRAEKDWFPYCLQRMGVAGLGVKKHADKAVAAGMLLVPIKYSTVEVLRMVMAAIPAGVEINRFEIRRFALWLAKQKLQQAQNLRGFSPETLAKANVQHLRIEGVRAAHGGIELPAHLADLVDSLEGVVIVRAPMGAGKTERLIAPLMQAAPKAAYIAHRISLLDDAAARLNIQHYQQARAEFMSGISHLACCVNSLTNAKFYNDVDRSWFTTIDTLCIDEASQVISHTASGPVDGRVRVMDALLEAVAVARRVLLCDADANDRVVEFCEMARPGQTITILEVEGKAEHIRVDHSDDETVWQVALDWICAGKRVLVANDSAESAKKMAALIEERIAEGKAKPVRMLLVHADSKADPDVTAFLMNPNAEAVKYDVLIYSPAISSGVSMTTPHFEHHVGLFSGNSVGPSDAIQMLRRDRTARHYLVGIGHSTSQRQTDPAALYRGIHGLDELTFEYQEDADEVRFVRKKTAFDQIWLGSVTAENRARNDFANNLLLMLIADGYQVERADLDNPETTKASRQNRAHAGELVFDKRMELVESVETPDEAAFVRLNRQEVRSEAESAQVDRFHMEHQLGVQKFTPDDVAFYDDRGIAKVVALELLQSNEDQAKAYDDVQRKARVVLTQHRYKRATRAFLVQVFDTLGVDRFTAQGEFSAAQCREVLAMITESQEALERYNAMKVGRYIASTSAKCCATSLVKSIIERFGVSVKKRKSSGANLFTIDSAKWEFVMAYVLRRQAINVHSLTTHETETAYQPKLADETTGAALEAPQALACSERDTLHCDSTDTDEKYPLAITEKLLALASRCYQPLGISLARLVGALAPEVVRGFMTGRDSDAAVGRTLAFAERLLRDDRR